MLHTYLMLKHFINSPGSLGKHFLCISGFYLTPSEHLIVSGAIVDCLIFVCMLLMPSGLGFGKLIPFRTDTLNVRI